MAPSAPESPLLQVENISKQFPGTLALDNVSFDVRASEVHVLFGENGAGKSTMIQILAGVHRPTAGRILLKGQEQVLTSVHHARQLGISAVFQEFSIVPQLTVEENLYLGAEASRGIFLDKAKQSELAKDTLDRLGFPLQPKQRISNLSRAEQQMVEIAKAFRTKPSVMIMDEPTASLTERETDRLFELIRVLKSEGIGIIYITHRMEEIKRIADRITVLRDGKFIGTLSASIASQEKLVEMMTGRMVTQIFPDIKSDPKEAVLELHNLCAVGTTGNVILDDVSLHVRAGEIVGIAGLVGSGKSEIGRASFGAQRVTGGTLKFLGQTVYSQSEEINLLNIRGMLDRGLYYVPSDRREEGLAMMLSVRENMTLSALKLPKFSKASVIQRGAERQIVDELSRSLELSPHNIERPIEFFSGGNQQKVLISKALARLGSSPDKAQRQKDPQVRMFIFDEPTVGVDVGARMLIYRAMRDLCESGAAILLISSDLPEILHLAHRAYVVHRGRLRAELSENEITEKNILEKFFDGDEL